MAALGGLAPGTRQEPATHPTRPGRGAMDWSDVRVFLAVARRLDASCGRRSGRANRHIARRLAAFEISFGGQTLFDRLPEGCASTPSASSRRGGRERRRRGTEVGAAARGGSPELERHGTGIDR
jgi:hypothetical protein